MDTFFEPNGKSTAGFNQIHIKFFFSILDRRFTQPGRKRNEYSDFCQAVDAAGSSGDIPAIYFADMGYASYNNFAHFIEILDPTGEYAGFNGKHCILAENSFFSYKKLTVSDLFLLLKPSERAQAPKLLEAVKTLKTLKIVRDNGGLDEYYQNSLEKNVFKKENTNKEGFIRFQRKNYEEIDSDELDFDIKYLARQIQLECIYDMDYRNPNSNCWGGRSEQDSANCISLVTRTNTFVNDKNYKNILGIGNNDGKEDLTEMIMEFLNSDNSETLLRIGFEKAAYSLNAFDQIAKECCKYGLFLCIATQMPKIFR